MHEASNFKTSFAMLMNMEPSITTERQMLALKILSDGPGAVHCGEVDSLVVSRIEAAKMIGFTPKRVDDFTRRGIFKRVYMPGGKRATGILRKSVEDVVMAGVR